MCKYLQKAVIVEHQNAAIFVIGCSNSFRWRSCHLSTGVADVFFRFHWQWKSSGYTCWSSVARTHFFRSHLVFQWNFTKYRRIHDACLMWHKSKMCCVYTFQNGMRCHHVIRHVTCHRFRNIATHIGQYINTRRFIFNVLSAQYLTDHLTSHLLLRERNSFSDIFYFFNFFLVFVECRLIKHNT